MSLYKFLGVEDIAKTKKCIKCSKYRTLDNFDTNMNPNVLRNDCRICRKKQHKELSYLKKQYSGTKPKDSNYRCPICDRTESDIKFTGAYDAVMRKSLTVWRLDHSHDTGKFRGWICDCCNRGLGGQGFSESVRALKNAIKYLEGSESEFISKS